MHTPNLVEARKRTNNKVLIKTDDYKLNDNQKNLGKNKKYFIKTYGCQMNEHDSENISAILSDMGYAKTDILEEADLIIFSSGSLLTSIIPNIIIDKVVEAIKKSKAPKLYICNLVTQPGETDDFRVSDHIKVLEEYLGNGTINMVLANNVEIPHELVLKYATEEQKDPVLLDEQVLKKRKVKVIKDKIYTVEDGFLRHDTLKTAYLVFSILMENEK